VLFVIRRECNLFSRRNTSPITSGSGRATFFGSSVF
jgi:hypothetical protein